MSEPAKDPEYHPIGELAQHHPRKRYRFHLETILQWDGVDPYDAAKHMYHELGITGFLAHALSIECLGACTTTAAKESVQH